MRHWTVALWVAGLVLAFVLGSTWKQLLSPGRSRSGMQRALDVALREPDSRLRVEQLGQLLGILTPENLPGAIDALEANRDLIDEPELRMVSSSWARMDAPGAFARVRDEWPQRAARRIVLSEITYDWALRDPASAVQAVSTIPDGDGALHEMVERKLVEGWAKTVEFRSATDYVASLPQQSAIRQGLTTVIAQERLKAGGPQALIDWAESVREDAPQNYRLVAFRKASRMLAQVDPQAAAAWLEKHYGTPYTDGVTRIVATQWAESDPKAAFTWLLARPDDDERFQAVGFAFSDWLQRDPQKAGEWLRESTPGPVLDPALGAYARNLRIKAPQEALVWAQRIHDEKLRGEAITEVGRDWYRRDPEAARLWLAEANLPAEMVTAIETPRGPLRRPPGLGQTPSDGLEPGPNARMPASRRAAGFAGGGKGVPDAAEP